MVNIKVFYKDTMTEYNFRILLDGMHWLKTHVKIDYIIIDDETVVSWAEWDAYFEKLNAFCKKVYGYWY